MIEALSLTKVYGGKAAVDGIDFQVKPGMVTGFLGPNGAGKSTTMRMILGLDLPTSGTVTVGGRGYQGRVWPLYEVGALLDARAVHPGRSAYDHLHSLAAADGIARSRVDEVLEMVGLTPVARKRAGGTLPGLTLLLAGPGPAARSSDYWPPGVARPPAAGCDRSMAGKTSITLPFLRLGRLRMDPALHALQPGSATAGLVVTATVTVPDTSADRSSAWDVAWADAAREASQLGADQATAKALAAGAGQPVAGGTRVVVAAHGEVLLARWLPSGAGTSSVRVGPLPHLREVAAAAARRPAYVVVLADRDGADIIAHSSGDQQPAERFPGSPRPGEQSDPHPGRPPGQLHGERHVTDREPESGGQPNAEFVAGRVSQAADSVGAHIVLGAGDQHILQAVAAHLPDSLGPVTAIAGGRHSDGLDGHLSAAIAAALDEVTATAIGAVGDLLASRIGDPDPDPDSDTGTEPAAVRGIGAVAGQLAEQQVAVLLVAADVASDADPGQSYRIGSRPTEFLVGEPDTGTEVPLEDGLVWAALHQDAIIVQLPDRAGPLAGESAAALLRRGHAADR